MTALASAAPALIAVFLIAAVGKVRDVRGFAATIRGYRTLSRGSPCRRPS